MRLYKQTRKLYNINNRNAVEWNTQQTIGDIFTLPLETTFLTPGAENPVNYYGVFQRIVDLWNIVRGTTEQNDPCPLPDYKNGSTYLNDGKLYSLYTNYMNRVYNRIISSNIDNTISVIFQSNEIPERYYTKYWDFTISGYDNQFREFSYEYELSTQLAKQFIQIYGDGLKFLNGMYGKEYNPLDNYNGREVITYSDFVTDYLNGKNISRTYDKLKLTHKPDKYGKTSTQKTSTNLTTTQSNVNINKGVGYDSTNWRNKENDRNDSTLREYGNDDSNKTTITETETGSYSDETNGKYTDATSGTDKQTQYSHTITTEKAGNLGVTTSCQMKTAEVEFWTNPSNIEIQILYTMLDNLMISKIY